MLVWIVNPYGNIPGEGWRDYRSTMLAKALESAEHETVWWVSNFEHKSKRFRSTEYRKIEVSPRYIIHMVPSCGYKKHISLARIRHEQIFSSNFYTLSEGQPKPDVIILADPALFYSNYVIKYANENKIKIVVDIIDIWPELFNLALPAGLSAFGGILFWPLYRRRERLLKRAHAIVSVCQNYLDIGMVTAPQTKGAVVYWGVDTKSISSNLVRPELRNTAAIPQKQTGEIWGIYAGTLGPNYDIETIIKAAGLLAELNPNVKIFIAGDGPLKSLVLDEIKYKDRGNLHYLGTLVPDSLTHFYSFCDFALSTYRGLSTVSMPIKAFDYLAAGLPMINSLERDLGRLVIEEGVGLQYIPENPKSLATVIDSLCRDSSLRMDMRTRALIVAEQFDINMQYSKFVHLLEQL